MPRRLVVGAPSTGRRLALVIGNRAYAKKPLANPVNDATDFSQALRAPDFR